MFSNGDMSQVMVMVTLSKINIPMDSAATNKFFQWCRTKGCNNVNKKRVQSSLERPVNGKIEEYGVCNVVHCYDTRNVKSGSHSKTALFQGYPS